MNALRTGNHKPEHEPFGLFARWMEEARAKEINDPEAMCLATVDRSGLPNARMVLLRGFDERGFVFYTNRTSKKGDDLAANPRAALCLYWPGLGEQVRIEGTVELTGDAELAALEQEVLAYPTVADLDRVVGTDEGDDPPLLVPFRLATPAGELSFFTTLTTFGTPRDVTLEELCVELFFPSDDATEALLRT